MKEKRKIAFIAGQTLPIPAVKGGAIETLVTALIEQNEKYGKYEFTVFCAYDKEACSKAKKYKFCKIIGVSNERCLKRCINYIYRFIRKYIIKSLPFRTVYMEKVNKELEKQNYDCIICESTYVDAAQVNKKNNSKLIYHVHSDYLRRDTPEIQQILQKYDLFLGVSDFISSKISLLSNREIRVHTLKNAIDIGEYKINWDKRKIIRDEIRKQLNIENDIVVMFCGRLSPEKGCYELINAIEKIPNVTLVIVGGNTFSSDKKTKYIQKMYDEIKNIKNKVVFTGYVSHVDIYKYLFAADIGVVPSICNEAASLTLLEFRAAGLQTIATKIGGIPEYASVSTKLIPLDEEFVDKLSREIKLMCNKNLANANKDLLIDSFNYSSYYLNFVSEIEDLCKKE